MAKPQLRALRTNEIFHLNLIVTINLSAVVELMVLDSRLTVPEGGTTLICVNITNSQQLRETDIILLYTFIGGFGFISMLTS